MFDFANVILEITKTFDVLAGLLATLYISIAVFAGQGLKVNGKNLSGELLIKYLAIKQISLCLLAIPLLAKLLQVDVFPTDFHNIKLYVGLPLLLALVGYVLFTIIGIISQRKFSTKITRELGDPVQRFIIWSVINSKEWSTERRDILLGLLSADTKSSIAFEEVLLDIIQADISGIFREQPKTRLMGDYTVDLLRAFTQNLDKRPLGYGDYYEKMLKFLLQQWQITNSNKTELYSDGGIYNLQITQMHAVEALIKYAIENSLLATEAFSHFKKFIDTLNEEQAGEFARQFDTKIIFETLPLSEHGSIILREDFPDDWKFTYQNLVENKNPFTSRLFQRFLEWSHERIYMAGKSDKALDELAYQMFPGTNTIQLARILCLTIAPYVRGNKMLHIAKQNRSFGFATFASEGDWIDDQEERLKQAERSEAGLTKNTYKLFYGVGILDKLRLERDLAEAEKIKDTEELSKGEVEQLDNFMKTIKAMLAFKDDELTNTQY